MLINLHNTKDNFHTNNFNLTNGVFKNLFREGTQKSKNNRLATSLSQRSSVSNSPMRFYKTQTSEMHRVTNNIVPLKDFTEDMKKTMSEYSYYDHKARKEKKEEKRPMLKQSSSLTTRLSLSKKFSIRDPAMFRKVGPNTNIYIQDEHFKNPDKAQEILEKNKQIYTLVSKKNEERKEVLNGWAEYERRNLPSRGAKMRKLRIRDPDDIWQDNVGDNDYSESSSHLSSDEEILKTIETLENEKEHVVKMIGHYTYNNKLFPECREQFTWNIDGKDSFLFGGMVTNKINDIWMFDPLRLVWKRLKQCDNVNAAYIRYGHSAVLFKKKLILFGGKTKIEGYTYIPDVEIYHSDSNLWSAPKLNTLQTVRLRRNQVACLIGYSMFIHGGINEDDEYLDDAYLLSLTSNMKWTKVQLSTTKTPRLAFHSCCLVLTSDLISNPKLTLIRFPEQTGHGKYNLSKVFNQLL
jgi:hypothetical protein